MTWRAPFRSDRQIAWLWACCVGVAAALGPMALPLSHLLPSCAWHAWTGLPCPGCGTTRAAARLVAGDLRGALAMNPLATAGVVAFGVGGLGAPLWLRLGGAVPVPSPGPKRGWMIAAALLVLSNWGWLVATGV